MTEEKLNKIISRYIAQTMQILETKHPRDFKKDIKYKLWQLKDDLAKEL